MTPRYVIAYDDSYPGLFIIELTPEEIKQSEQYSNIEQFLDTLTDKYGPTFTCSSWMVTDTLRIHIHKKGREVGHGVIEKMIEEMK